MNITIIQIGQGYSYLRSGGFSCVACDFCRAQLRDDRPRYAISAAGVEWVSCFRCMQELRNRVGEYHRGVTINGYFVGRTIERRPDV